MYIHKPVQSQNNQKLLPEDLAAKAGHAHIAALVAAIEAKKRQGQVGAERAENRMARRKERRKERTIHPSSQTAV